MLHHPGSSTAGSRAGSGIFAVVEKHAGMQAGIRINGLAAHGKEELPAGRVQVLRRLWMIDIEPPHRLETTKRKNGEGHAR